MTTMTLRLNEDDAQIIRKYAQFEGKSLSDFIRDSVFERIADDEDLATLRKAISKDDGIRYTQSDVLKELGF